MPGNELLPEHHGTIITHSLQEWACLFPQDLPFGTVGRLLGWQTQQPKVISKNEVRRIVQRHGEAIRAAEAKEVNELEGRRDLNKFQVKLLEAKAPRHRAAWPAELSEAVEQALKACDLIVAKRQKNRGMHWSEETADALAALKTVVLNRSWDLYWQNHQILPLATAT
jgi:Mg2+/Co2+ transporter CorB